MEVTYALGCEMLLLVGAATDADDSRRRLEASISSGRALETFGRVIEAQGGNPAVIEDPAILPQAGAVEVYRAPRSGVVAAVEPRRIGRAILELGGGRLTLEDEIDPSVGFVITVKPGDAVERGDPVASVFARDEAGIAAGLSALGEAIVIGVEGRLTPLITHRLTSRGAEVTAGAG
jgi:pyrimidine-nucleoside phosphorylase